MIINILEVKKKKKIEVIDISSSPEPPVTELVKERETEEKEKLPAATGMATYAETYEEYVESEFEINTG